jgi:hypothetical protein
VPPLKALVFSHTLHLTSHHQTSSISHCPSIHNLPSPRPWKNTINPVKPRLLNQPSPSLSTAASSVNHRMLLGHNRFLYSSRSLRIILQLPRYPLRISETSQQRLPLNGQQLHIRRDWICCDKADPATIASITRCSRSLWNRRIFCVVSSPKSIRASAGAPV